MWGGWTFWAWTSWSGGGWRGNTSIGVATWTWGEFFNVTVDALDLVDVDDWAARVVAVARVGWAIALVLFRVSSEFHGKTLSFFAHWWSGAFWSGFTFTVDDLFTAHVWIGVSVDGDQMSWTTVWIEWSSAFGFFDLHLFVFTAVVSFTFIGSFKNGTNVDSSDAVFEEAVFLWTWSEWTWSGWGSWSWGTWSGGHGGSFASISVLATVFKTGFDSGFTGSTSFNKTQSGNMSQTFVNITSTSFSGATKIGSVGT